MPVHPFATVLVLAAASALAAVADGPRVVLGPYVSWTAPDAALVHWETDEEVAGVVEFGETTALGTRGVEAKAEKRHAVALQGLKANTRYFYALQFSQPGGRERVGERFELETDFNFTPAPLPDVKPFGENQGAMERATQVLADSDVRKGCALLLGDAGPVAWEIARRSELSVIAVSGDGAAVQRGRTALDVAGVYGRRVQILRTESGKLPFAADCFDLVVVLEMPGHLGELSRVLRPAGGMAWFGESTPDDALADKLRDESVKKGRLLRSERASVMLKLAPLDGAGAWSHAYGDAAQTANSGDTLVRGDAMRIQWFGQPGARGMMDRQGRNPPPLVVNDTLYTQGNRRLYAQNASNGAMRWSLEIPGLRRVNIPRDSSNMCADDGGVFLAIADRAWHLNARDGTLRVSHAASADGSRDWGYLANVGNHIFGTTVKPASSYTRFEGGEAYWYDTFGEASTAKVCGDSIFCVEKKDGKRTWTYAKGLVIHSTISIGEGRVVFIESRNPALIAEKSSRIGSPELYKDLWLVALDAATGRVLWEKSVALPSQPNMVVLYTTLAAGKVVVVDSTDRYHVLAYDARDGAELWHKEHAHLRKDHGAHMYHPVVARGAVIVEPFGYDLATGEVRFSGLPKRGGCSTMSAAANCVHYINWDYDKGSMYFWDLSTDERRQMSGQRGSCWLSLISGSGMTFLPTSSSGCVCRYPNQVSVGLAPGK